MNKKQEVSDEWGNFVACEVLKYVRLNKSARGFIKDRKECDKL